MRTLVDIDGTETFADVWNGGRYAFHSAGNIVFNGEGGILANVDVSTGNVWMRFRVGDLVDPFDRTGFCIGDSSGNFRGFTVNSNGAILAVYRETGYSTYTAYDGDGETVHDINCGVYNAANFIGITITVSTKLIRIWNGTSAALPDSVTSWDSGAEDASFTATATLDVGRIGLFSRTLTPESEAYESFTGGNFAAGPTQLVDIDGTEAFADVWNGTLALHSGGNILFLGQGGILANVYLGASDVWCRFKNGTAPVTDAYNIGPCIGDASGNFRMFLLGNAGDLRLAYETGFDTYTIYNPTGETDHGQNIATVNAANPIGFTFQLSTKQVRIWYPATAAAPDSVSLWDGGAPLVTITATVGFGGGRLGLCCFSGVVGTETHEYFVAGNFDVGHLVAPNLWKRQRSFRPHPFKPGLPR